MHNSELFSRESIYVLERKIILQGFTVKEVYFLEGVCPGELCSAEILFMIRPVRLILLLESKRRTPHWGEWAPSCCDLENPASLVVP